MGYEKEAFFETPFDVVKAYENGFIGADCDPEQIEELRAFIKAEGGIPDGAEACAEYKLEETGKGKLSVPFMEVFRVFPDCLPGPAQGRGDCVSHGTKNAGLVSACCEITDGKPDEVTGRVEGAPEISDAGRLAGVFSTEAIYNWRRHGGDGWSCGAAAKVIMKESGLWVRKNYPEINVDFTTYSSKNAGIYGSKTPPESWLKIGQEHLVRTATVLNSYEEIRDMLHNGYGISSCGSEGYSNTRDENGVSSRKGSWAHAMAYIGVDDREEIIKLYKEPLICVMNSWGNWNDGGRRVYGTNVDIPNGAFWARWSEVKNREAIALSSVNGWPPRKLKDFGALGRI